MKLIEYAAAPKTPSYLKFHGVCTVLYILRILLLLFFVLKLYAVFNALNFQHKLIQSVRWDRSVSAMYMHLDMIRYENISNKFTITAKWNRREAAYTGIHRLASSVNNFSVQTFSRKLFICTSSMNAIESSLYFLRVGLQSFQLDSTSLSRFYHRIYWFICVSGTESRNQISFNVPNKITKLM